MAYSVIIVDSSHLAILSQIWFGTGEPRFGELIGDDRLAGSAVPQFRRQSYLDIVMVAIVGAILGLVAVIGLGTAFGSF